MGCFQSKDVLPVHATAPTWKNISILSPARLITMNWKLVRSVANDVNSPIQDKFAGFAEHHADDFNSDFEHNRSFSLRFANEEFDEILVCTSDMK